MPISEIATLFRITNPSARARVADLRDKGYRVCSDTNGYWMASDEEDYLEYRKAYMHKILTRLERLKAMDNYGCLDGQIPFEFDLEQLKGVC